MVANSGSVTPVTPAASAWHCCIFRVYTSMLVVLLPLKFGSIISPDELGSFPASLWQWLFSPWPAFLFSVLAGGALLLALLARPQLPGGRAARLFYSPAILWTALLLACFLGLVHSSELDYAWRFLWYLAGVCSLVWAVTLMLPQDSQLQRWLFVSLVIALFMTAYSGWQQVVFGGFEHTLAMVYDLAERASVPPQAELVSRLEQNRAFGEFVYPNSYAGYLILTLPVVLVLLWRAGASVEPGKISQPVFAGSALAFIGAALYFSMSRAGILCLGLAVPPLLLFDKFNRRQRWLLALIAVILALSTGLAVNRGRHLFSSVNARLVYYHAAMQMTLAQPLTGVGLGEFFPHYIRLKPAGAEETRQPHNLLLAFASQAGVGAALLAALILALPFLLELAKRRAWLCAIDCRLWRALQVGLVAWALHALLDFHLQIPALVATAALLPVLMQVPPQPCRESARRCWLLLPLALCAVSALWLWPQATAFQRLQDLINNPRIHDSYIVYSQTKITASVWPVASAPWATFARWADARGMSELAVIGWQQAVQRAPHRAGYHYHLAVSLWRCGDIASASVSAAEALHWYPGQPRNQQLITMIAAAQQQQQ